MNTNMSKNAKKRTQRKKGLYSNKEKGQICGIYFQKDKLSLNLRLTIVVPRKWAIKTIDIKLSFHINGNLQKRGTHKTTCLI